MVKKKSKFAKFKDRFSKKVDKYLEKGDKVPLSIELKNMLNNFTKKNPTFGDFLDYIKEKGFGFLLMIIALPSALPVPAGGYSFPFAILIIILGFQIISKHRTPFFPKWVMKKKFSKRFFHTVFDKFSFFAKILEFFSRPRAAFLFKGPFRMFLGCFIIFVAIVMAIPFPLSNTFPALSLLLIGFSMLNNDGIFLILSYIAGIIAVLIATFVTFFGIDLISAFITYLKTLI